MEAAFLFMVGPSPRADVKYNVGDDRVLVSIHQPQKITSSLLGLL